MTTYSPHVNPLSLYQGVVDLHLYPYGNAKQTQNPDGTWKFKCQHGPTECDGNIYEACIMHLADYDPTVSLCENKSLTPQ